MTKYTAIALATVIVAAIVGGLLILTPQRGTRSPALSVHVRGNHLVNQAGRPIRLLGVDRSGTEYMCLGSKVFLGPSGPKSVDAMASWHIDAVRIPLNEDCWLGINGADPRFRAAHYRAAISHYVRLLNSVGMTAILDLHWNAPGRTLATGQEQMADQSHSPAFWTSVARTFRDTPDVVFDLYNEPWGISWGCWQHGCTLASGWRTAGMQELVDDVRGAGARQPILLGGLDHSSNLSAWVAHEPRDPLDQLIASVHIYDSGGCDVATCWDSVLAPLSRKVPVVTAEMGERDCGQSFIDTYMEWADRRGISYLAWAWDAGWNCGGGPSLVTSWAGAPTAYGLGFRTHLEELFHAEGQTFSGSPGAR